MTAAPGLGQGHDEGDFRITGKVSLSFRPLGTSLKRHRPWEQPPGIRAGRAAHRAGSSLRVLRAAWVTAAEGEAEEGQGMV